MNKKTKVVSLEERLSGDELLNARDLLSEINHLAKISEEGYVSLYHRTSIENAKSIMRTGKMSSKEDGIFFSTKIDGEAKGYGEAVIELQVPIEKLVLDDIFYDEAHLKIPLRTNREILDVSNYLIKVRLFIDLDGTAAVFEKVDTLEKLYEKGYFLNLEPNQNVVDAIHEIAKNNPEIELYIMSSVLSDSKYALQEKNQWIDKYLPEIDMQHRVFPPCGESKLDYVPNGVRETDCLLDDYTHNLTLWEPPARGIKLLNGINHTRETWRGNRLRYDKAPEELAENIVDVVLNGVIIRDIRPQKTELETIISNMEKNKRSISDLNEKMEKRYHIKPEVPLEVKSEKATSQGLIEEKRSYDKNINKEEIKQPKL